MEEHHNRLNLRLIDGGAGAGALIGGLARGRRAALMGRSIGASAGAVYATGRKDVCFAPRPRLSFRLAKLVRLNSASAHNGRTGTKTDQRGPMLSDQVAGKLGPSWDSRLGS